MDENVVWTCVETSQVVSTSPVKVRALIVTDSGGNADITMYDGESSDDPLLTKVRTLQNLSTVFNLDPPLETRRGLYVAVGSNVNNVLIHYTPVQD